MWRKISQLFRISPITWPFTAILLLSADFIYLFIYNYNAFFWISQIGKKDEEREKEKEKEKKHLFVRLLQNSFDRIVTLGLRDKTIHRMIPIRHVSTPDARSISAPFPRFTSYRLHFHLLPIIVWRLYDFLFIKHHFYNLFKLLS